VYGRIGTCTQEFGTLASWLVDVLNVLTGNLDEPGGAMFAKAATGGPTMRGTPGKGRGFRTGRRTSRVRGLPESLGELPVICLAEEITTPGEGQVRALITVAGNPALSAPNSDQLQRAFDQLDFMVSVDPYLNETTRHADVILPGPSVLAKSHYDLAFYQFSLRNIANYSPPVLPLEEGAYEEWKILARLALIVQGMGATADPAAADDVVIHSMAQRAGLDPEETMATLAPRVGPDRMLDLMLRTGPYDLTLDDLIANPHGIDLGPLEPRLPDALRTASGKIELAAEPFLGDVPRLRAALDRTVNGGFVLIGRRHLRSNNSWMHNVGVLMKGKPRCTLQIHPADAERLGITDTAKVSSRTGAVVAPVEITDTVMRGVVSLPHGWGHDLDGVRMDIARANAGVNSNLLADEELFDPLSGNAVLNGIPVEVAPG
jgi:anaerobic selenocysteine-containing dehydrogenase